MLECLFLLAQMAVSASVPTRPLRSPCPDVFAYERAGPGGHGGDWVFPSEDHRWRGVVTVPPVLPVFLKVKLLTPALLPSPYVGRIELAENKTEIVKKINNGNLDKIRYFVYFPAKIPVPELILIEVNSRILCSKPPAPRRLKTVLTLEHSLMPVTANVSLRGGLEIINKKPVAIQNDKQQDLSEGSSTRCGRTASKDPLISGNRTVSAGEWPWMIPLFKKTELGLRFLCSSTLISLEFAVTAAHCIRLKNSEAIRAEDIVAYAGRFDITNWTEEEAQPRDLSQVLLHPDFDPNTLRSDLALLKFSRPLKPSSRVRPACLWTGNEDLAFVVGKKAVVFGWGSDGLGRKVTATPKLAVMPIVSQEECLRSKMEFVFLTSDRTLCAGFRNGTGPCSGDSGGGLLIPFKNKYGDLRWILRGVVSFSLLQDTQIMCDVEEYTVFTDVAKYQNWLSDVMGVQINVEGWNYDRRHVGPTQVISFNLCAYLSFVFILLLIFYKANVT